MIVVALIGVLSAMAIYGMRRYVTMAKTSEAKLSIGAITRLAVMAYTENAPAQMLGEGTNGTTVNQVLCGTAIAVPAAIPHATKYQPRLSTGLDWDTGNQANGWNCLGFAITQPIYYQYLYTQGSGYIGPTLGAPNPGASGFEVTAQGDISGDGNLQTFALSGLTSGPEVKIASTLFINNDVD
jgi:type IV pilus assembly protein PilA